MTEFMFNLAPRSTWINYAKEGSEYPVLVIGPDMEPGYGYVFATEEAALVWLKGLLAAEGNYSINARTVSGDLISVKHPDSMGLLQSGEVRVYTAYWNGDKFIISEIPRRVLRGPRGKLSII